MRRVLELLYVCDDESVVKVFEAMGLRHHVADFDLPRDLLEAVGVSIPDWMFGSLVDEQKRRLEVVVQAPLERLQELLNIKGCTPTAYRVEVQCDTEECAAKAAVELSKAGMRVYRRGLFVYGFGDGVPPKLE